MTRTLIRQVFRNLQLTGDVYRGEALIKMGKREWHIPRMTWQRFHSRQAARDWIQNRFALEMELMESIA